MNDIFLKMSLSTVISMAALSAISWNGTVTLSDAGGNEPRLTVNGSGNAAAIWNDALTPSSSVQASLYDGVSWQTAETISIGGDNINPSIRIDSSGNIGAIWEVTDETSGSVLYAAKPVNQSWQAPTTISEGTFNSNASLVINAAGQMIAAWINADDDAIVFSQTTFGQPWPAPAEIGTPGGSKFNLLCRLSVNDTATVGWIESDTGDVYVSQKADLFEPNWTTPIVISDGGLNTNFDLSTNNNDDLIAVWVANASFNIMSRRYTGGSWEPQPVVLSTESSYYPVCKALDTVMFVSWLNTSSGKVQICRNVNGTWEAPVDISSDGPNGVPAICGIGDEASVVWTDLSTGEVKYVSYGTTGSPSTPITISASEINILPKISCSPLLKVATWTHIGATEQTAQVNMD